MAKRILILDYGEYFVEDIKKIEKKLQNDGHNIDLLISPDYISVICSISYSYVEMQNLFGEAFIWLQNY